MTNPLPGPAPDTGTVDAENPWPGLAAFREADQAYFRGREQVADDLVRLILRARLSVLYGLSGLGKTSLLRAGVFPPLRHAGVLPVYIRLRHGDQGAELREQVWDAISASAEVAHVEAPPPGASETLWGYFFRKDVRFWNERNRIVTPLLVFDQFEEIFTVGRATGDSRARAEAFVAELADLVEGRPPASVKARLEEDPDEAVRFSMGDQPCKVLLSLREDFLPDLGELRSKMTMGDASLRLRPMTSEEALRVVRVGGDRVVSEDVATRIVQFVASAKGEPGTAAADLPVEPALLSVFCRELNNKRRAQGRERITADLLEGSRTAIISDFYERTISEVARNPRLRVFVEERLLTESGFRDSMAEEQALRSLDITADDLDALIARRLLRREEAGTKGRARIELTHDVLADAVRTSRDRRRLREQEERRLAEQREIEARERQAAEEAAAREQQQREVAAARALAEKEREAAGLARALAVEEQRAREGAERVARVERRARVRQLWFSAGLLVLALLTSWLAWRAYSQRQKADQALAVSDVDRVSRGEACGAAWPLPFLARAARKNPHDDVARAMLVAQLSQEVVPVAEFPPGRAGTGEGRRPSVRSAAFSRDGTLVLSVSDDGVARTWSVRTRSPQASFGDREPFRHEGRITSAAFSDDGTRLMTVSDRHTARLFTLRTGESIALGTAAAPVALAALAPDGTHAVTITEDGAAWIWRVPSGSPVGEPLRHTARINAAVFSPDSARIVTVSDDGLAQFWDARTAGPVGPSLSSDAPALSVVFAPDGSRLLTLCLDRTARLWDARTGALLAQPLRHEAQVSAAAFSADGSLIVTAAIDGSAQVWDGADGTALGSHWHDGKVRSAAFSPDGTRVLTASEYESAAAIWDPRTGRSQGAPLRHEGPVTSAAFSADGLWIVTASDDGTARVWDARTGRPHAVRLPHGDLVNHVAFAPEGRLVVTASDDGSAAVWDPATGQRIRTLKHDDGVNWAAFGAGGTKIVTASEDGTARLWEAGSGAPIGTPMRHGAPVAMAAFSARGDLVVTAASDGTARLWDGVTGSPRGSPLVHDGPVVAAVFEDSGARVVTASEDGTRIWEVGSGSPVPGALLRHDAAVTWAVFGPGGRRVLTTSKDRTARLWDAQTARTTAVLPHADVVTSGAFSPGGEYVVTASEDRTARVWNADTGALVGAPLRHEGAVTSVAFSGDGRVMTGSLDGTVRVWNVRTGAAVGALLLHDAGVVWVAVSPDGSRVVSASGVAARVWDVPMGTARDAGQLAELAEAVSRHRVDDLGGVVPLGPRAPSLDSYRAGGPAGRGFAASLARWIVADPWTRAVSPLSAVTVPDYVQQLLGDEAGRKEAERTFPGHPALVGHAGAQVPKP